MGYVHLGRSIALTVAIDCFFLRSHQRSTITLPPPLLAFLVCVCDFIAYVEDEVMKVLFIYLFIYLLGTFSLIVFLNFSFAIFFILFVDLVFNKRREKIYNELILVS